MLKSVLGTYGSISLLAAVLYSLDFEVDTVYQLTSKTDKGLTFEVLETVHAVDQNLKIAFKATSDVLVKASIGECYKTEQSPNFYLHSYKGVTEDNKAYVSHRGTITNITSVGCHKI